MSVSYCNRGCIYSSSHVGIWQTVNGIKTFSEPCLCWFNVWLADNGFEFLTSLTLLKNNWIDFEGLADLGCIINKSSVGLVFHTCPNKWAWLSHALCSVLLSKGVVRITVCGTMPAAAKCSTVIRRTNKMLIHIKKIPNNTDQMKVTFYWTHGIWNIFSIFLGRLIWGWRKLGLKKSWKKMIELL